MKTRLRCLHEEPCQMTLCKHIMEVFGLQDRNSFWFFHELVHMGSNYWMEIPWRFKVHWCRGMRLVLESESDQTSSMIDVWRVKVLRSSLLTYICSFVYQFQYYLYICVWTRGGTLTNILTESDLRHYSTPKFLFLCLRLDQIYHLTKFIYQFIDMIQVLRGSCGSAKNKPDIAMFSCSDRNIIAMLVKQVIGRVLSLRVVNYFSFGLTNCFRLR